MSNTLRPRQKVSDTEKSEGWYEDNADYLIGLCDFTSKAHEEMDDLYAVRDGIIDEDHYDYVLNPYNTDDPTLTGFPAKLRNYDIITPVFDAFMGEKAGQEENPMVVATTEDIGNKMREFLSEQVYAFMAQDFVNKMNAAGHDTGVEDGAVPEDIAAEIENIKANWVDDRAIIGQEALDYLRYNLDTKDQHQKQFEHYLTTGRVYTYKEVYRNDVLYETVDPRELYTSGSPTNFVEDGEWAVRRQRWSVNEVIDRFREHYSDAEIDRLEEKYGEAIERSKESIQYVPYGESEDEWLDGAVYVYHCVWKGWVEKYILVYYNELTGRQEEMEVDEDYELDVPNGDIEIQSEWVNRVHHVFRIGGIDGKYVEGDVFPIQRNEINNTSKCKLPFNGLEIDYDHGGLRSIVKKGIPYQVLYNIIHYRGELTLADSIGKIMLFPKGLVPKGWKTDKWLYELKTGKIGWFDETAPNAGAMIQYLKSIDLSLSNYVAEIYALLESVKMQWWDAIGVNRQRMSDIQQRDGKANTEQAIFRSSVITAELYRKFDKFVEKDYNGLIDNAKVAFIDGKKGSYITSDKAQKFFEVNGVEFAESEYSVFVKDTRKEAEKVEIMKGLSQEMLQNGVSASALAAALDTDNLSKMKLILKQFETTAAKLEAASAEAERAASMEEKQIESLDKEADRKSKEYIAELGVQGDIEVAHIQAGATVIRAGQQQSEQGLTVSDESVKTAEDFLNDRRLAFDKMQHADEMADKQKERESKEKIAKTNKNRYDK